MSLDSDLLPLDSLDATLETAGGKGANLAKLARAGFPVPGGFIIPTRAYRDFTAANRLEPRIQEAAAGANLNNPAALEALSEQIRAWFSAGQMPDHLEQAIRAAYTGMGVVPVAVRSSATAEDLPDLSFAGQQDTYLNIIGEAALIRAVIDCWSSLWTARAIGYRARNRIAQHELSLAVVVQELVQSEASGVLFTANPLTGTRTESVIDATVGLGEALVSGLVEPDQYIIDTTRGVIISRQLGAKAKAIRPKAGGGVATHQEGAGDVQALPDEQILALVRLGQQAAAAFGSPQDIEWAWANGKLYLLQSRPITSLYPLPEGLPPEPVKVLFSFGSVQGMLDPMTPYGRDLIRQAFVAGAGLYGIRVTRDTQTILYTAGERLWGNITTPLRNSVGRKIVRSALGMVDPAVQQALGAVWEDPRLQPGRAGISFHSRAQIARALLPVAGNVLLNLLAPNTRRAAIVANGERTLEFVQARCAAIQGSPHDRLAQLVDVLPDLTARSLPHTLILFLSGVASGMASLTLLNRFSKGLPRETGQPGWNDLVLETTRGLPHNPTTEMDLALWQTAQTVRSDPLSLKLFQQENAATLASRCMARTLPPPAQQAFDRFLEKYGGRGLAEIDTGRPRWREDPTHIFEMLAGYLEIESGGQAPDAVFARSAANAEAAVDRLAEAVGRTPGGWIKSRLVRFAASRARALLGMRESPKFFVVRMFGILRAELLKLGREFVQSGELSQPDDLIYLTLSEQNAFAAGEPLDWKAVIASRREAYQRELQRRQIPRLLLSDGRAFYEGLRSPGSAGTQAGDNMLTGSPVSPGTVEGSAHVVLDPRGAHLAPGEILVCPGTDPSWTPLFLAAGGLVMEVGGLMTHGSVVAREYGIPAVVGVHEATTRLKTGQRIQVDGSTGTVRILESEPSEAETRQVG